MRIAALSSFPGQPLERVAQRCAIVDQIDDVGRVKRPASPSRSRQPAFRSRHNNKPSVTDCRLNTETVVGGVIFELTGDTCRPIADRYELSVRILTTVAVINQRVVLPEGC